MMKKNKILLCLEKIDEIDIYEKLDICNFLFPLKDYVIGYNGITFDDIKKCNKNIYVLMNRLLTDEDIDNFLKLDIPKKIRGFVVEDIGLIELLKNKGYEVILYQNHLNNNYETINYWLRLVDSLIISTDITRNEIDTILEKTDKPLVLNTFLLPIIMYSRRRLITNFYRHKGLEAKNQIDITEPSSNLHFLIDENKYGTAVYNKKILDYRQYAKEINDTKIKFYLFDSSKIDNFIMKKAINGEDIENTTTGFLDKKTIYKVGDIRD